MPKATQLVLNLESRPGVLAKVARVLSDASINITAVHASEGAGRGKIRLLVDDRAAAVEALKAAKYRVSEESVLVLELDNRPGTLARVAGALADARINVKYAYATSGPSGRTMVVLAVANVDKAAAIVGH